jgi:hypothetical protein
MRSSPTPPPSDGARTTTVAVGTALAGGRPRRSQRAELPHWAPGSGQTSHGPTPRRDVTALRPVFVDLLGEVPPIGWTDEDLLEIGTGRRPLTAIERDSAGSLAARFPLLS